jgi:hypothetical protein
MTTVAFDGRTLAADRLGTIGGTPIPSPKIFRVRRLGRELLVGFSGDYVLAMAWLRWMEGGEPPPTANDPHDLHAMVIDERRRIWIADLRRVYTLVQRPRWATGSGADYAMAAMELGRSAPQAVRLASKLDINTGWGVDWLSAGRGGR